jgi:hypothetical protein
MPRLLLKSFKSDAHSQSHVQLDVLPSQGILQDLLFQLLHGEFRNPHFQLARTRLRGGHCMRAIQDTCYPFNFDARVSRCGCYIKFDVCISCLSTKSAG